MVGTDKRSGLLVYDLRGNQLQHLPAGNLNNVDLRTGAWGREDLTIAVASAREPDALVVFELDHASREVRLARRNDPLVDEPYGVCLYLDASRQPWVVLNGKDGLCVQFELHPDYAAAEARRWRTQTQPEDCVADDEAGVLYIGEEGHDVSDTDGVEVTSVPLPGFPEGLLVVQDGANPRGNQNFKFASFSEVRRALRL